MVDLSKRMLELPESGSMKMNELVRQLTEKGEEIINLSIGEPHFSTPENIINAGYRALKEGLTHYSSSKGLNSLREAVAKKLEVENNIDTNLGRILITPGGKQALFYILAAILNPKDEVIVIEPCWLSYVPIILLNSGIPVPVAASSANQFIPKLQDIASKISPSTKAIIMNNPCNPTGAVWGEQLVTQLVNLCKEKRILLIADEVYENIIFGNKKFFSARTVKNSDSSVAIINGLSKRAAMCGWRLAYIEGPELLVNACSKLQSQTLTCVAPFIQMAGIEALNTNTDYMVEEYERARDLIFNGINSIEGLSLQKPSGTFYAWIDIRGLKMTSDEAVEFLLNHAKVAVVSGSQYGATGEGYVRISFAQPLDVLKKAMSQIRQGVMENEE